MAQVTSQTVPNGSGASVRSDMNDIFGALFSSSSGATAPSPTVGGMWWLDTSASPAVLKVRNTANTAWISVSPETLAANTIWANLTGSAAAPASYTMTQLATAMGFSQSLTEPYEQELPGGIMMQAGSNATGATGITITFPTAFSAAPAVLVTGVASTAASITIRSRTATSFVAEGWDASGVESDRSFTWIAMGPA